MRLLDFWWKHFTVIFSVGVKQLCNARLNRRPCPHCDASKIKLPLFLQDDDSMSIVRTRLGDSSATFLFFPHYDVILCIYNHRIKISNRSGTQRCNVSAFFYAKICSLLARRRSSQPVQRVYWPENVIDWLGKWRPTCVMRHARGHKLQSFRRKCPFYMDLYSML